MTTRRGLALALLAFGMIAVLTGLFLRTREPLQAEDFGEPVDSAGVAKIIADADREAQHGTKVADEKTVSKGTTTPEGTQRGAGEARRKRGEPLPLQEAAFRRATEQALASLPKRSVLDKPGRSYHWAPPELLEGIDQFGRIADAIQANPSLVPQGLDFYRACALSTEAMTAVRAACLRSLKDLAARHQAGTIDEREFPEVVRRLSDKLPSDVR